MNVKREGSRGRKLKIWEGCKERDIRRDLGRGREKEEILELNNRLQENKGKKGGMNVGKTIK